MKLSSLRIRWERYATDDRQLLKVGQTHAAEINTLLGESARLVLSAASMKSVAEIDLEQILVAYEPMPTAV